VRDLLLVGGGHAHLEVLRRIARRPLRGVSVTLVSSGDRQHYSGMAAGFVAGDYGASEFAIELSALCRAAGAEFVRGEIESVDADGRNARLREGRALAFDAISFAVGSALCAAGCPGVRDHAFSIKPVSRAVALREKLESLAWGSGGRATVVGAGAAGIEIAFAAAAIFRRARSRAEVLLLDARPEILDGYGERFRRRVRRALDRRGIAVRLQTSVSSVEEDAIRTDGGERIPSDATVWATGPAAPDLFRRSRLDVDREGFLRVDEALRSTSHPGIFGAGDCVTLERHPEIPKAGVYAVREAPILDRSLRAFFEKGRPPRYAPQRGFLSILGTSDGKALLRYGPIVSWSRWAWGWKQRIDREFVRRYQEMAGEQRA
jgi:selenide, water dikinase